jgi:hypothetical protein
MSKEKEAHGDGRGMKVYNGELVGGWTLEKKNQGGKRRWEEGRDEEMKRRWLTGLELGEEGDIKEG